MPEKEFFDGLQVGCGASPARRRLFLTRLSWPILALSLLIAGCRDKSASTDPSRESLDRQTLESLKRVDDFPLYTMTFFGSYGFSDYLKTGRMQTTTMHRSVPQQVEKWACTCFAAMGEKTLSLSGRNFDWMNRASLLLFTHPPDGFASVSMVDLYYFGYDSNNLPDSPKNRQPMLATPFYPFDGMNEKGVAVGMMAVTEAEAPFDPNKVTIGDLQLIRLILDYAGNVDEAVSLASGFNIRIGSPPIHYLITDSTGNSAVLEFVDGEMVVIRNQEPWQVSANFIIHGTTAPLDMCWRYKKAYESIRSTGGVLSPDEAMDLLQQVSQSNTMWSVVYSMCSGEIRVAVGRQYDQVHSFVLKP